MALSTKLQWVRQAQGGEPVEPFEIWFLVLGILPVLDATVIR